MQQMCKRKICIVALNYYPEVVGCAKYNTLLAKHFTRRNFKVNLITSYPHYPSWKKSDGYNYFKYSSDVLEGVNVLRCPIYVPKQPTAIKRSLSNITFFLSSFTRIISEIFKGNRIFIVISPTILPGLTIALLKKIFRMNVIIHFQDVESLALKNTKPKAKLIINILNMIEKVILKNADHVSVISRYMADLVRDEFELDIQPIVTANQFDQKVQVVQSLNAKLPKTILYAGSLGNKQNIDEFMRLLVSCKDVNGIQFKIVSSGPTADVLKQQLIAEKVTNVIFHPLIENEDDFFEMFNSADAHMLIQHEALGDELLPSKLSNMLASGKPCIVIASGMTGLARLKQRMPGIFEFVDFGDKNAFIGAVCNLRFESNVNHIAIKYARENHDPKRAYFSLEQIIEILVSK